MEVSGNHPVVMDDHVSIETHGDLGITHFQNPPYIHIHVCIALHYITLHYIALHYTALHYITLHYITLHCTTLHRTTLHYITLHYITLCIYIIILSYHIIYHIYYIHILQLPHPPSAVPTPHLAEVAVLLHRSAYRGHLPKVGHQRRPVACLSATSCNKILEIWHDVPIRSDYKKIRFNPL